MYYIDAETLEWAYRKLKAYYYSYHGNNLIKDKIIRFEKDLKNGVKSFRAISNDLNSQVNEINWVNLKYDVGYVAYPKKNAFRQTDNDIGVDKYNTFVDIPIEYYLVDVIFAMNLMEKCPDKAFQYAYAFKKSSFFERTTDILHNNFLFEHYWNGYKRWCSIPRLSYRKDEYSPRTILKLDIKECFYNTFFNFKNLTDSLGVTNKASLIMGSIYRKYSAMVLSAKYNLPKETNISILPIGLLSSSVLQNYLYSFLDEEIVNNDDVISYGRFVDDIYVVLRTDQPLSLKGLLCRIFHNDAKNPFVIKQYGWLMRTISINNEKVLTRFITEKEHNDFKIEDFYTVSFVDDINLDSLNLANEIKIEDSDIKEVRSVMDSYDPNNYRGIKYAIMNLTDCDLLNCYSLWSRIFKIAIENRDEHFADSVYRRIEDLIERTKLNINDDMQKRISNLLRNQLKFELEFARDILDKQAENLALMDNIDDESIQKVIGRFEKYNDYIPFLVSISDISIFYSNKYKELTNCLKEDVIETYKHINNIASLDGYELQKCELTKTNGIVNLNCQVDSVPKEPIVAVAGLNMKVFTDKNAIDEYSSWENFGNLGKYNLYDLKRLADEANKNGANYLLLPEFAVRMNDIPGLVKHCRSKRMSLVCGAEHYEYDGTAYNITCIFDRNTNLVFFKPKNYLPLEEKIIISKRGCNSFDPIDKKYLIVDDGMLTYSTMTCYEATNIIDRALLTDKINFLFVPVYNKDTNYFSNIIESYCRDASIYIAQANCNKFGDSRIRQPSKTNTADLVKIKGGDNNYVVVSKIDVKTLEEDNISYLEKYRNVEQYNGRRIKPLNAGNHHFRKDEI